jgi:hypothetical protein
MVMLSVAVKSVVLGIVTPTVVMLSVFTLNVVAPFSLTNCSLQIRQVNK